MELEELIEKVRIESEEFGLFLNVGKTKVMVINQQEEYPHIHAGNEDIEIVDQFNFLGSMISNQGGCSVEIRRRIGMAKTSMCSMNKLWKDRNISKATKICHVSSLIFPIATYACEAWVISVADQRRMKAFEMWCWRKLLCIPWTAKKSNVSVRHEIGVSEALFSAVVKQRLQYFGLVARRDVDNLEKGIMFGKVKGKMNRGRQRLRWVDGITTQTKMSVYNCYTLAQNRHDWRCLTRKVTNTQS